MSLTLRPYQHDLLNRARVAMQQGSKRILIQSSTGSGKTVLTAAMLASAVAKGRRCWFICHRRELVDQSVQTFIEAADLHTGTIAAGYPQSPLAPVQVCSVQTLRQRLASLMSPDLVVWDECHHVASKTWSDIAAALPHATHIGLTATPQRLDGRGLGPYFDTLICGPTTAQLMADGYLSRYTLYAPPSPDLSGVHRVAGDYDRQEAASVMDGSTVMGDALSHYQAHCPGARALVFAWSIEASERIAAQFRAAGIEAQHVDGETPRAARQDSMRRYRHGDVRVLCNVDLFGEGLDVPAVDAVFLLRPTQSLGLYLQQVGRGLRPSVGKSSVRIFDHVNNWERHGLPDDDRQWSLDGRAKRQRDSAPMGKRCGVCFGVSPPAARQCRYCGLAFPVQVREVEQVDGVLAEANIEAMRALWTRAREFYPQCKTLADWQRLAKSLGYRSGWAWRMHSLRQTQRRSSPSLFAD